MCVPRYRTRSQNQIFVNVENFYYYSVALPDIVNGGFCFSTGGVSAASAYTRFLEFRFLIFAFFLGCFWLRAMMMMMIVALQINFMFTLCVLNPSLSLPLSRSLSPSLSLSLYLFKPCASIFEKRVYNFLLVLDSFVVPRAFCLSIFVVLLLLQLLSLCACVLFFN